MMTAYTTEVDEIDEGLDEIFSQIDLRALRKHSVGLVTCHFDFIDAGFIAELRKRLPFDVIGMTTMASANKYGFNMYALSLTVLTSDDVVFETAITGPMGAANYREEIAAAYAEARKNLDGDPALIISFFPYLIELGGAPQVRAFDEVCGGIPIWGSLVTNIELNYRCQAFRNNTTGENSLAMLLIRGPVDPEFIIVSLPEENIRESRGIITESEGCVLKKINGMSALKYLESQGIIIMKNVTNVSPFMVYYEGASEPVALGIYNINEDGSLLCGGEMPVGSAIAAGEISAEGIIASAREGVKRTLQSGRRNGVLMFPCVSRYVMLSPKQDSEMELVISLMGGEIPFMLGYSGGEVCPVRDDSGKPRNHFHNFTFSVCAF
jgi:hypothetical protein